MRDSIDLRVQTPTEHLDFPAIDVLQILLADGWAEFFPNHLPVMVQAAPGAAVVEKAGTPSHLAVSGGLLRIERNGFFLFCHAAARMEKEESFEEALASSLELSEAVKQERSKLDLQLRMRLWQLLAKGREG